MKPMHPEELPEILSAPDVGKWLGMAPSTVRKFAKEGKLPGVQIGSLWRFSRPALTKWLADGGPT